MPYKSLGSRALTGISDNTGNNLGNWTVKFDATALDVNVPYFEIYKIIISGAPNSQFDIFIGANQWEINQRGDTNIWNGAQQITPGTEVYFYWNDPVTDNNPPKVILWLRYATDIPENMAGVM